MSVHPPGGSQEVQRGGQLTSVHALRPRHFATQTEGIVGGVGQCVEHVDGRVLFATVADQYVGTDFDLVGIENAEAFTFPSLVGIEVDGCAEMDDGTFRHGSQAGIDSLLTVDDVAVILEVVGILAVAGACAAHADLDIGQRRPLFDGGGQFAQGREWECLTLIVIEEQVLETIRVENATKNNSAAAQRTFIHSGISYFDRLQVVCHLNLLWSWNGGWN